ncbi:glycosyltransferase family 1 protein [Hyaloscypha finlandica]|nr:glycosyltransferase family 1 protein [Hyaloscypha finlandica]
MVETTKPLILACCLHQDGHFGPIATISKGLIECGYEVTIYTGSTYREKTEVIGASFLPFPGKADWTERSLFMAIPQEKHKDFFQPPGPGFNATVWEHMQVGMIPDQHAGIQKFLQEANEENREVIILHECTFWGALPSLMGSGMRPLGVISVGIQPLALSSPEVPPFGSGLKYDPTPESHERNAAAIKELFQGAYSVPDEKFQKVVESLGGTTSRYHVLDAQVQLPDRYIQLCVPGLEYPRSEFPKGFQFAGGLPKGRHRLTSSTKVEYPEWWGEVTRTKKPVVVVCGGTTINIPYQNLIIPTMQGLANEDVIVVVSLGCSGAKLPPEVSIPENSRVIDYFPYDELFPYADVFVNHGGYGGLQHAMNHGLPVVTATGITDKPENAARAEWAGVGISLGTHKPSPEKLQEAVKKVLSNESYRLKAQEIEEEMTKFDVIQIIVKNIEELGSQE